MSYQYDLDGQLALGSAAPNFSLPDTSGKIVNLADYKDKVRGLVVIFSCNHCPWVIKWEDRMIELARMFETKNVLFVCISSNDVVKYPQDGPVEMAKRAKQKGYPFPYLYDATQEVAHNYGAQVTPHIYLFDDDMRLCYRGAIDDNPNEELRPTQRYLMDAIETLLNKGSEQIKSSTTKPVGCSVKWK